MTRIRILIAVTALLLLAGGFFYLRAHRNPVSTVPRFADHAVHDIYRERPAQVDFSSHPDAEDFRTAIMAGVSEGANFAGHYTVVSWGCGTSCQNSAIVDTETGRIIVYGVLSAYGLAFQPDSRLLVVNPKENLTSEMLASIDEYPGEHFPLGSTPAASDYYLLEGDSLSFIGRYGMKSGEAWVCEQALSPARNPFTGEMRDFASSCEIPFGWEALETAEGAE